MELIVKSISENPYMALIVELATILSFIIAVVFPIVNRKKKQLVYSASTTLLVNDKLSKVDGLSVAFNGVEVGQLSVTSVSIKNNGNLTIEASDIFKNHKLTVFPDGDKCKVIDAKAINQSSDTVGCEVSVNNNEVIVDFGTFEKKDFATVNIYHTGDEKSTFKMKGKIKEGVLKYSGHGDEDGKGLRSTLLWTLLVFVLIMVISLIVPIPFISNIAKATATLVMGFISAIFITALTSFMISGVFSRD